MKVFSNGLKGWKQSWKGDLRASVTVAFIVIPLGLGIGLASGVPPMAAVIPSMVGGLIVAWFSGGNVAVHSTPKMLIGVTAAAVMSLGGDDPFLGYRLFLGAVVVAGIVQFLLGIFRLGIIGDLIPVTVIKSLLASVGLFIIVKQFPILLGVETHAHSVVELIISVPQMVVALNPLIVIVGIVSTAIMFLHPRIDLPVFKAIPAAVWVIIVSVSYSYALEFVEGGSLSLFNRTYTFGKEHLIDIPSEIRRSFVTPDFSIWKTGIFWNTVLAITVISSLEGILSAKAIDRLDPLKRKSNVNKELSVMGIGTSLSGAFGGLPVIPGIVPSSVGVSHNGKSQMTDVFQAVLILVLILVLGSQLQHIPLAALAGILIHTGYKLVNPSEVANIYRIGWDQISIFLVTLIVTLSQDLIIGIAAGIALTLIIHVVRLRSVTKLFTILFRPNVVAYEEDEDNKFHVSVKGYSNFLNYPRLKKALDLIPHDASINVDLSLAEFIDHTVMEHLAEYEENHIRRGGDFEIIGLDTHLTFASHPLSMRFMASNPSDSTKSSLTSRQQKLQQLAAELKWVFDPNVTRYVTTFQRFQLFRHKAVDRVYNKLIGPMVDSSVTIEDVDFHEGEFQTKVKRQATVAVIGLGSEIPKFTIEKERLFDKIAALSGYDDIDFKGFSKFSDTFKLTGENEAEVRAFFTPELIQLIEKGPGYRFESSGSSILILGKDRLMNESEIRSLTIFSLNLAMVLSK